MQLQQAGKATTKQITAKIHRKWRYSAQARAVKLLRWQTVFTHPFKRLSSRPSKIMQITMQTKIAIT